MSETNVVLITGASSGIGQATARNLFGIDAMPGVEMLTVDVRLDESVNACVDAVLKKQDAVL